MAHYITPTKEIENEYPPGFREKIPQKYPSIHNSRLKLSFDTGEESLLQT